MKAFLVKVLVNAVAIWVATLVVQGMTVRGPGSDVGSRILTYVVIGAIFGIINAIIKPIVKLLTLPFYVITLGLFTFVVNAFMLQLTSWVSEATPLTFHIQDFVWTAILGAVVVTFVSMVLNLIIPDGKD